MGTVQGQPLGTASTKGTSRGALGWQSNTASPSTAAGTAYVSVRPLPLPDVTSARQAALLADLERLAGELLVEDLPDFLGGLERARWVARVRLVAAPSERLSGHEPLLTVEQLAAWLGVSESQVYRMAKTTLRPAAVDVGGGTLRFDPGQVKRFLEARRRA